MVAGTRAIDRCIFWHVGRERENGGWEVDAAARSCPYHLWEEVRPSLTRHGNEMSADEREMPLADVLVDHRGMLRRLPISWQLPPFRHR